MPKLRLIGQMWLHLIEISRYTVTFQFNSSFKTEITPDKISKLFEKFQNYLKILKIDRS